ncbi:hypothetical protein ABE236_18335 [Priestia endophytica]|uniref:hypothetical protein n=1 Tax=Priestia endophytica TaxID=135735 RepID=UPI003D2DCB9D
MNQKELELAQRNSEFWEHFTDHLIIAFSFLALGIILGLYIGMNVLQKKIKIDPSLEKGQILRVYIEGKKWFIVNPVTKLDMVDMLWLAVWDRKNEEVVSKADRRMARIMLWVVLFIVLICTLSGVILIFSALEQDVNIFNHLF